MKLTLPMEHTERWVSRRGRGVELTRVIYSPVEVDVPEIVGSRVVASWQLPSGPAVALRHVDGVFYLRATPRGASLVTLEAVTADVSGSGFLTEALSLVDFLVPRFGGDGDNRNLALAEAFAGRRMTGAPEGRTPPTDEDGYERELRYDGRLHARQTLDERSGELAIIEGELWRRVDEPWLQLFSSGLYGGSLSVRFDDQYRTAGTNESFFPRICEVFGLRDKAAVDALVAERGVLRGGIEVGEIVIHDPDVFAFDRRENILGRTAVIAVWAVDHDVGSFSSEAARAFVSVREMAKRFEADGTVGMSVDAGQALIERVLAEASSDWQRLEVERNLAMLYGATDRPQAIGRNRP